MKTDKYSISIQRDAYRCNERGCKSTLGFPKAFGDSKKNNFISVREDNESILKLKTPMCKNIAEAYNKLEEITNVVFYEMYNQKELLYPCSSLTLKSNEKVELFSNVTLSIDKEFYEEMKKVNVLLPESVDKAYLKIKEEFNKKSTLIESLFGRIKIKATKTTIQLNNIKLNYEDKCGISESDILFLVTFIFGCLIDDESKTIKEELKVLKDINSLYHLKAKDVLKEYETILKAKETRLDTEKKLSKDEILEIAFNYRENGYNARYCLQKYTKLAAESVVIIKDAIAQGIDYNVLNEAKSLVEFDLNGHKEYVIEGNKTDRDSYIFPIITDDKFTSKEIMAKAGLNVPKAILLEKDMDKEDIEALVSPFYNSKLVVKPRNTNYGTGITVFSKKANKTQILNAIEYAFKFDTNVLIEEYQKGMEYRFLVVNGKCLSVAHRRIASVVGDGSSTIKELIDSKNKEPWHFLTACPVKMDEPVVEYLKLQDLTLDSVIPEGQRVFLRTNSNCSTGGESVDYTYTMPSKFKKIAEKASRAFDAKICGVDIIIEDFEKDDYAIIEINDNPGYSINEWPYEGNGEKIGLAILNLLNLKQE